LGEFGIWTLNAPEGLPLLHCLCLPCCLIITWNLANLQLQ